MSKIKSPNNITIAFKLGKVMHTIYNNHLPDYSAFNSTFKGVNIKYLILLSLIFFSSMICNAQNKTVTHNITTKQGLTDNNIHCILQDSRGYVWFGSEEGLHRYDGYSIEVFRHEGNNKNSVSANFIRALYEDVYGRLWIGTDGGGISVFDLRTEQFSVINSNDPDISRCLTSNEVFCFAPSRDNHLWVGTKNGLNYIKIAPPGQKVFTSVDHFYHHPDNPASLSYPHVYSLLEDRNGTLWVGTTEGGLSRLNPDRKSFTNYKPDNTRGSISSLAIMTIYEDRYGDLWFGTWARGLNLYDRSKDKFTHFNHNKRNEATISHDNIYSICEDHTGDLWVGTYDGGINKLIRGKSPKDHRFERFKEKAETLKSIFKNKVKVIYPDNQGNLWLGTIGGGVIQMYQKRLNFDHLSFFHPLYDEAEINHINDILRINNDSLLIANNTGLFYINRQSFDKEQSIEATALLNDSAATINLFKNQVNTLHKDANGTCWIGTNSNGLLKIDSESIINELIVNKNDTLLSKLPIYGNKVLKFLERENKLWVLTNEGVNVIDINSLKNNYLHYSAQPVLPIKETFISGCFDSKNRLWLGTQFQGAFCFELQGLNKPSKLVQHLHEDAKAMAIAHQEVQYIRDAGNGAVWLGTSKGFHFIDIEKGVNKVYKEKDGLPSSAVTQVYEKDNILWLGTIQGMARFKKESATITPYFMTGGFLSNYFATAHTAVFNDGYVALPSHQGLWAFYPDSIKQNPYPAIPVLSKISLAGRELKANIPVNNRIILEQSLNYTDEIELKHHENIIQIEFASLSFKEQDENQFMYKLEGLDDQWHYADVRHRSVSYSNLSPNTYTFVLKAANNDGEWNPQERRLKLILKPPYYKTWYAYLSYFIIISLLTFIIQRYLVQRVKSRENLRQEKMAREKEALLHQMKIRFFTNVSHEFRTPLTLIAGPLQELLDSEEGISYTCRQQLELMKNNTDRLLRLINQLMDFKKVTQGNMHLSVKQRNIASFVARVAQAFQGIADQKQIHFSEKIDNRPLLVWFDAEKVETIIFNLLSNAFKFTPAHGHIGIEMENKDGKEILIRITDTGSGIVDEEKLKIFERFYQSEDNRLSGGAGTGVGLSLVKELVNIHKGTISVEDNEPSGTVFTIILSVHKDRFGAEERIEAPVSNDVSEINDIDELTSIKEAITMESGENPKVLIVEDQEDLRQHLNNILKLHYKVDMATNGIEGLEKASSSLPDIIVSDVMMPEMDGFTFCKKLRDNVITSHIPVIMLTALDNLDSKQEGLESGADAYVVKPFNKQLLVTQIQNLLSNRQLLKNRFKEQWDFVEEIATTSTDQQFVNRAVKTVEENMADASFNVSELVKKMNVSRTLLHMKLRELTGQSTSEFIRTIRLKHAAKLLKSGELNVSEVTYQVGFNDPKYFSKSFKSLFGTTPTNFQKGDASGGELTKK